MENVVEFLPKLPEVQCAASTQGGKAEKYMKLKGSTRKQGVNLAHSNLSAED